MAFIEALRRINLNTIALFIFALIPYLDTDIVGVIPVLRDVLPWVEPIYYWELSWTERGRLAILWIVPYVDGEVFQLLGLEVNEVISD